MVNPGIEDQSAEDAAKPRVSGHRSEQTDTTRAGSVNYAMDFRPTTILEQSQMGGHDRVTKPVGVPNTPGPEVQTTGGRGATDYIAAVQLGANGRK